jgi:hypothetical protein
MPDHEADLRREISESVELCRRRFSRHGKCVRRMLQGGLGMVRLDLPIARISRLTMELGVEPHI